MPLDHRFEIIEGASTFSAKAFESAPNAYLQPVNQPAIEPLPHEVETWLIEPVKAPELSLEDATGNLRTLKNLQGNPAFLVFWSTESNESLELLNHLKALNSSPGINNATILAVNADKPDRAAAARLFASQNQFPFSIVFATENDAGIYNIFYSHLFDRRRNLPIPLMFLLDGEGQIVKVYQGKVDSRHFSQDAKSIPATNEDRMKLALPFKGLLAQDAFQRNVFTFGVAFYQNGYLEQATATFQQVIATKPEDADAYYNLGTLSLHRKDYEAARQYLQQTLKLRPDYPEAWNNLGMLAAQSGQAEEALNDFQRSLALRPDYAIALLNLGNLYRSEKMFGKAEESLKRAVQLDPGNPEANYSLGMLFAQQGQMQSASDYLQKALAIRPDYPEAINNLGVLFVRQDEYEKAESQFLAGIRVAPEFDQSYLNLARLYLIRNEKGEARKVLLDLLQLQPQNAAAKRALEMLQ